MLAGALVAFWCMAALGALLGRGPTRRRLRLTVQSSDADFPAQALRYADHPVAAEIPHSTALW